MRAPFRQLNMLSNWILGLAGLSVLGGVIGGIVLMTQTETTGLYGENTSHPLVWLGIVVLLAGLLQALFLAWLAYYGKAVGAIGNDLGTAVVRVGSGEPGNVSGEPLGPRVEQIDGADVAPAHV